MITVILEKIPFLIAGAMFLFAAVIIYFRSKNVNKNEIFRIFKTAQYFNLRVIILSCVLILTYGIFSYINMKQSVSAIVSLNYSEASLAQNSNGTRYNMTEIICDEVIERAIKKGAFENVTVNQLKKCLYVYPCVQGGVGHESEYHISTEFTVGYTASKHTDHLDAENVIQLITAAYKEYYTERYTDNFRLDSLLEQPEFNDMEYMDIVLYLDKEASAVLNYLYGMVQKAPSFATENNTTFNSIAGKVYQFRETQINQNLRSLILQNGIAKDKAKYIDRLSYKNMNIDFERQKNAVSYDLCNQAIARYAEEMTRIVLVPTWDQTGKYYMGRTKVGIDELSVQATEYSNNVASNEKEIMDNNLIIDKISDNNFDNKTKESVDKLIETIYNSIKAFEKEAISAGREYSNYRMNQCISVSIYGLSLMAFAKKLIIFAGISYISLMLFHISRKFPKKA